MSLTVDQAKGAAVDERARVLAQQEWKIAFTGAEPQPPLLVRAPPPDGEYYIVEFRQTQRPTGLMLVNARTGEVDAVTGISEVGKSLRFLAPDAIPAALDVYRRKLLHSLPPGHTSFGDFRDGLVADLHPGSIRVEPELVWESCDQSLTPFRPFYKVHHTSSLGLDTFLVRVDGEPHATLTNGGAGM